MENPGYYSCLENKFIKRPVLVSWNLTQFPIQQRSFVFSEFKKNLPCMNKIGKDVEKTCDPKCEPYEHALDKLEKFGLSEGTDEIDTAELRFLFKEGCK